MRNRKENNEIRAGLKGVRGRRQDWEQRNKRLFQWPGWDSQASKDSQVVGDRFCRGSQGQVIPSEQKGKPPTFLNRGWLWHVLNSFVWLLWEKRMLEARMETKKLRGYCNDPETMVAWIKVYSGERWEVGILGLLWRCWRIMTYTRKNEVKDTWRLSSKELGR